MAQVVAGQHSDVSVGLLRKRISADDMTWTGNPGWYHDTSFYTKDCHGKQKVESEALDRCFDTRVFLAHSFTISV